MSAQKKEREYIGRMSRFANFYKLLYFPADQRTTTCHARDRLDKTESVFMLRFEAARNHWGLTADYIPLLTALSGRLL